MVLGSTGLIGSSLLKLLVEDDSISGVTVFVRKLSINVSNKVKQILVDFDNLEAYSEHFKVDFVFCCLGTTMRKAGSRDAFLKVDYTYVIQSAKIAKQQGIKNFSVISSMGANPSSRVFYSKVKGQMELDLQSTGFETLHIFRPSLLLGERKEVRRGERIGAIASKVFSFAFIKGLKKYKPIQSIKVAKSMLSYAKAKSKGLQIIESNQMNS